MTPVPQKLLRVVAPHFVAGAVFERVGDGWMIGRCAPIIAWMRGKPPQQMVLPQFENDMMPDRWRIRHVRVALRFSGPKPLRHPSPDVPHNSHA